MLCQGCRARWPGLIGAVSTELGLSGRQLYLGARRCACPLALICDGRIHPGISIQMPQSIQPDLHLPLASTIACGGLPRLLSVADELALCVCSTPATAKQIFAQAGLRGFYRGLGPTVLGYLPTWAIYFSVYDEVKSRLAADEAVDQKSQSPPSLPELVKLAHLALAVETSAPSVPKVYPGRESG